MSVLLDLDFRFTAFEEDRRDEERGATTGDTEGRGYHAPALSVAFEMARFRSS
jgi:hypothetical protein